ncbi:hypothetical protein HPP92_011883 [Vanilla planifolia]|uniref:Cytochrome P450 n=2 Tax=Vanilla planifolia TaxID=51239 RepID=A0A835R3M3_VANPL|nr:hypothetical protein HPP92_011883 [Vanilla planifolia]
MELPLVTIILQLSIFLISLVRKSKHHNLRRTNKQPPGPSNLPIIGSIHRLLGSKPTHRTLRQLSATYGPIMRLKFGEVPVVVISSSEAAEAIMKTNDLAFASRPISATVDTIFYGGNDIIFGRYDEFWRQMRRLCATQLLSLKRVRSFRAIRQREISRLVRSIAAAPSGSFINLSEELFNLSNNITVFSVIGGRFKEQKLYVSTLGEVALLVNGFSPADLFPSIPGFIMRLTGCRKKLELCRLKLNRVADMIVREHRAKQGSKDTNDDVEDFTDVLLKIQEEGALPFPLSDDHIKAVVNDMLIGGSETSSTAMDWAMSELVRHPEVMKKVQQEVREAFGEGVEHKEEAILSSKLRYLQMVVKETLRLHPPLPLLLPRVNDEACEVMGYEIPTGTTVLVNAWAIGRDPEHWQDPESFLPERFEDNSVDFKGGNFDLIPFGGGRRMCPGINFGLATVETTLANLLYYFDWEYKGKEELDMTEGFGVGTRRKSPLCLAASLRLPLPPA